MCRASLRARSHDSVQVCRGSSLGHNGRVPSRRLFILRHGKTPPAPPGMSDHERPLNKRGRVASAAAGRELPRYLDGPLDLVLASTAVRVRETIDAALDGVEAADVQYDRALYSADVDTLLETLRALPDDVRSVLLCGHNPSLHQLALTLLGDGATPALREHLPPAGLVVIDLDDADGARLVDFISPPRE